MPDAQTIRRYLDALAIDYRQPQTWQVFPDRKGARCRPGHRTLRLVDALGWMAEAQDAGFESVGVDLICGIPGETNRDLEDDVRTAMTFQPRHVSAYQLTLEEGTPLTERLGGEPRDEDDLLGQMRIAARMLSRGGWNRYEISNFAKPSFECRHNVSCWHYGEYLGLGAAAASFVRLGDPASHELRVTSHDFARRWTQVRDTDAYVREKGVPELDRIDARTAMAEFCFLALRTSEGISPAQFREAFGSDFEGTFESVKDGLIVDGLLAIDDGNYVLTDRGREISNQVFTRFI